MRCIPLILNNAFRPKCRTKFLAFSRKLYSICISAFRSQLYAFRRICTSPDLTVFAFVLYFSALLWLFVQIGVLRFPYHSDLFEHRFYQLCNASKCYNPCQLDFSNSLCRYLSFAPYRASLSVRHIAYP